MTSFRLLIACGGTGGHIFPAIALADNLRKQNSKVLILFIGMFSARLQKKIKLISLAVNKLEHFLQSRYLPNSS